MDLLITSALAFVVTITVINFAALHTWIERKQSALMQDRIGANRARIAFSGKFLEGPIAPVFKFVNWALSLVGRIGLFHPIADAIKMFTKEDFIPPKGDKFLHTLAPFLSMTFALIGFAAIPFGDVLIIGEKQILLQVAPLNVGILYVFAAASMGVYGVILAGFSSNNNYAFLGGLRAASQMLAYELVLGLTILGVVMIYGSLDLQEIVRAQGANPFTWGWALQPVGFICFLIAGLAETKRAPYDLPEAESEIIGYFTEYSGMKFGMFFFTDFIETIMVAALASTLFLGGWQIPFLGPEAAANIPNFLLVLLQITSYSLKVIIMCWVFMTIRWTLPRFRYDQLMDLAWKGIFPIAVASLIVTAALVVFIG